MPLPVAQRLDGLQTGMLRRCPGAASQPAPDGSAPLRDSGGNLDCDPTAGACPAHEADARRCSALVAAVVVAGSRAARRARTGEQPYRVRAIFDNAGFVIPGEDVKIAGVKVGRIESLDVTDQFKAAVVLEISEPGYQDFRRDASCIVRPQSLIGERFVECKPTQPRAAGSQPPPALSVIEDGPGKGQRLLPVENTSQSVDIDVVGNTLREPERERLSLILNELGTGLAGRGRDLNEVIRRANPALRETDKVLSILAAAEHRARSSSRSTPTAVLAPLARDRASVAGAIRNSSDVAKATAERRAAISRTTSRRCRRSWTS